MKLIPGIAVPLLVVMVFACQPAMQEKIVEKNGVRLYTQSTGEKTDPPVLLIMGATASMLWWDEAFCRNLAERGFFVIRYDNRDTGKSTSYSPGEVPYSVVDLADDALAILDAYEIKGANLVGMSLGGMIAQILAISHPKRVHSLTLLSTSVWDDVPDLPQMDDRVLNHFSQAGQVNWSEKSSVVDYIVKGWKLQSGPQRKFDETAAQRLANAEYDRAENILSSFNHAQLSGGEEMYGEARKIKVPTLILHGTEDPVLPFTHAEVLHRTIKNAKLVRLEGAGHEIHPQDWNRIIESISLFIHGEGE